MIQVPAVAGPVSHGLTLAELQLEKRLNLIDKLKRDEEEIREMRRAVSASLEADFRVEMRSAELMDRSRQMYPKL